MVSFSGSMLGVMAVALFIFAVSELRAGRLGAALVLGVMAVVTSSIAASMLS